MNLMLFNYKEMINTIILILTAIGAFITAIAMILSYIKTNEIFILSQIPSLLIQIKKNQQNGIYYIFYKNCTNNEFIDLNMIIKLNFNGREFDLSKKLFITKMFMAAKDERSRLFNKDTIIEKLNETIINEKLNKNIFEGHEHNGYIYNNDISVKTSYNYIFYNKTEKRLGPTYIWKNNFWDLQ